MYASWHRKFAGCGIWGFPAVLRNETPMLRPATCPDPLEKGPRGVVCHRPHSGNALCLGAISQPAKRIKGHRTTVVWQALGGLGKLISPKGGTGALPHPGAQRPHPARHLKPLTALWKHRRCMGNNESYLATSPNMLVAIHPTHT